MRRARAMTLLEVVVATAALAAVGTLVAALWAQTRDWTLENAGHHRRLRVERALTLLDDQWRARARSAPIDRARGRGAAVALAPETLEFVSTTPIFYRESPMVRVTVRLEMPRVQTVGQARTGRIVYTESPDVGGPASGTSRSVALFEDVEEARFERWLDERDAARADGPAEPGWREVRGRVIERAADDGPGDDAPAEPSAPAGDDAPALRAGRLVARVNGDTIVWQFLAAPSR